MTKSVRLHYKYGLNPTIPTCYFCGQPKDEIVLLGDSIATEAPMYCGVIDYEPCSECQEHMKTGIILIGVDEEQTQDLQNPCRSGHFLVVTEDCIRRLFKTKALVESVLDKRIAFVDRRIAEELVLHDNTTKEGQGK